MKRGIIIMAIKHINQSAKEESGILLSGADANKVFSMFADNKTASYIKEKKTKLQSLFIHNKPLTARS
jgi:hypothetical protein